MAVAALLALVVLLFSAGGPAADIVWIPAAGSLAGLILGVWTVARAGADRRAYEQALMSRAATDAVVAERLALARDLHDVVSHGLGFITVRAAVTRHVGSAGADALAALADIEAASRTATLDLRRMLALLRDQQDVRLSPSPGVADIPALVKDAEANGLRVSYVGAFARLSPGAGVVAYRVMQEALTNVARHAGPTAVEARCEQIGANVVVQVQDAGPVPGWASQPGAGVGLRSLGERLEAIGGTLRFGPSDQGGFAIVAELPDER